MISKIVDFDIISIIGILRGLTMINNIASLIAKSLSSSTALTPIVSKSTVKSNNPFAAQGENANPFLSTSFGSNSTYGKNQPVAGGYFAGYHNGKPNIVGRKLFIEI